MFFILIHLSQSILYTAKDNSLWQRNLNNPNYSVLNLELNIIIWIK